MKLFCTFLVCTLALVQSASAQTRAIEQIKGDLYKFQNNAHYSVFLVTDEGILVTDPIDKDAATWLKAELKKRFNNKPIKYLVYSHDHRDHISGGEVFEEETIVVAHQRTKEKIIGEKRPTAVPDVTFTDRMTIELGGKTVNLLYVGRNHSDNSIVMHFPAERAIFAVDFISIDRLPYQTLGDAYVPEWIASLKTLEALDIDIVQPGHGKTGTRADVTEHREYVEALYEAVLTASREGKTLDEMKQSIMLKKYTYFDNYDTWRIPNIEGMYRHVNEYRVGNYKMAIW